ncbi:hypothetical protein SAMN04488518_112133 [Pseudovibrio ascidiaceicola]|uniref:Uncharacterized protein n=1 Tax=Pseudovibrio ascidiaceicola TaxID=285279 RepID=A0A1I4DV44_9HYPH|nr:hypothetical protein SAMN04488518_112133 [Pseudovibrio ascidiaceicola]
MRISSFRQNSKHSLDFRKKWSTCEFSKALKMQMLPISENMDRPSILFGVKAHSISNYRVLRMVELGEGSFYCLIHYVLLPLLILPHKQFA